jgi:hypothetical protein
MSVFTGRSGDFVCLFKTSTVRREDPNPQPYLNIRYPWYPVSDVSTIKWDRTSNRLPEIVSFSNKVEEVLKAKKKLGSLISLEEIVCPRKI